ncbi:MAG: hypothetical protein IPO91_15665 [Chloroflexi bacterium]|nr:hypothetical protein [Chloroflexota bacterium]
MQLSFPILIAIWLLVISAMAVSSWKRREQNVGGILAFVIFLAMIHLLQAITYIYPNYTPRFEPEIILLGFTEATIALVCFAAGAVIVYPALRRFNRKFQTQTVPAQRIPFNAQDKLAYLYTAIGIGSYFFLGILLRGIPTAQAFTSSVTRLWHVGSMIWLWEILHGQKPVRALPILAGILLLWPVLTVVRDGFLGFGLVPTIVVLLFIALRVRRVWMLIIPSIVIGYLVLSIIAVYFQSRGTVRAIVWAGEYTQSPLEDVYNTLNFNFRWFDPNDPSQLTWIDGRLGFNYPLGKVIQRIDDGIVPMGNGRTIENAMLMLIPRLLWPEKPIIVGGSVLFQYYTGIPILGSTSVGLSPVVELYANYKTIGVVIGFLALGIVMATLDYAAAGALKRGDNLKFAVWMLPIFGLILVQDDIFTVVGAAVAGILSAVIVNMVIRTTITIRERKKTPPLSPRVWRNP